VAVGQEVEVQVLDVELDRERVSLSLKATQEDPWKEFERMHKAGEVIAGQVTKLVPFGAFVRVAQGIEGLVHISELSHEHVDTPESVLSVGDEVQVKVVDVDVSRRRVSLSMRQVSPAPAKATEIEVEPEPERAPAEPLVQTVQIPQAVLDAVAEAETDEPAATAVEAASSPEPRSVASVEPEVVPAPEADEPAPEAPVPPDATVEPPAPEPTDEAPATDEEVSLEAILEDLKRREGSSE
jgi:small subunit ribosomal protein S1